MTKLKLSQMLKGSGATIFARKEAMYICNPLYLDLEAEMAKSVDN